MDFIPSAQATVFKNADTCTAFEYATGTKDLNLAKVTIAGRYPESGRATNNSVAELVYVVAGSGTVCIGAETFAIAKGDVLRIEPGESFVWEGRLELLIACAPAWSPQQYSIS